MTGPVRQGILVEAVRLTTGDRNKDYGDPSDDFARTAAMWSAYKGVEFDIHDVPIMMVLLKVSRCAESPYKLDNFVDMAGYSALAGEVRPPEPDTTAATGCMCSK